MKSAKPALISPSTPSTRLVIVSGMLRLNTLTATVQIACTSSHSGSEPSCAPHTAAKRKSVGSSELEFCATYSTEKSFTWNEYARHANAKAVNTNCPATARFVSAIQCGRRYAAPARPKKAWGSARQKARISAKCPSSAAMTNEFLMSARLRGSRRWRRRGCLLLVLLAQALRHFGRHIVSVVFRQHFVRDEHAVAVQLAARDHALPVAKQIGQHAAVADSHVLLKISDDEAHFHAAGLALHTALLDHAAEPEHAIHRRLARGHIRRRVVIEKVVLERSQRERCRRAHSDENEADQDHPAASRCHRHAPSFCISMRRRAAPISSRSARRADHARKISMATVTA